MTVPRQTNRMTYHEWLELQTHIWNQQRILAGSQFEITAPEEPVTEPGLDSLEAWILGDEPVTAPSELEHGYSLFEPKAVFDGWGLDIPVDALEIDDDERCEIEYAALSDELESELAEQIRSARFGLKSSFDGRGRRQVRPKRGKRGTHNGLHPDEVKTFVGRKPAKPRKHRPAKPRELQADEGTKRDVGRLLRPLRALLPEQQRMAAELIAPLAGAGLTAEAIAADPGSVLTVLLVESKRAAHRKLDDMRRAAGRNRLTNAERQQCFARHDELKRRLAELIAEAGRCRFAEMSSTQLVALAIDDASTEAEIRRELIAYGTSAANSGRRKREAMALFHEFDTALRTEQERRAVDTGGKSRPSYTVPEYQGTVPDDGIEL